MLLNVRNGLSPGIYKTFHVQKYEESYIRRVLKTNKKISGNYKRRSINLRYMYFLLKCSRLNLFFILTFVTGERIGDVKRRQIGWAQDAAKYMQIFYVRKCIPK
jgi:hypothetical protein